MSRNDEILWHRAEFLADLWRMPCAAPNGAYIVEHRHFSDVAMSFDFTSQLTPDDKVETFAAGQLIFAMGQPGDAMYIVKSGKAEIRVGDHVYSCVEAGGTLGEMALLDDDVRSASAVALTDCEVVAVKKDRLLAMVQRNPLVALEMTRYMVQRLRSMNYQAQYDLLTHLPNRTLFREQCQRALIRAARQDKAVGLLHMDLDHFENINDSLGYAEADKLLAEVATRLQLIVRSSDVLARLGADEFALLVDVVRDEEELADCAERLLGIFAEPFEAKGAPIYLGASIGITWHPGEGNDVEVLLKNADTAMHAAKRNGRNQYAFFSSALNAKAIEFLTLKSALRQAIDLNQLSLHYQPRVDLKTGKVLSVEALMRWNHPEMGFVSPARFIPIAEETGLIEPLGEWALMEGCRQQKAWVDAGIAPAHMAVNLSARQMGQEGLVDTVRNILKTCGLPADRLELEITESALMDDPNMVVEKLKAFRELGVAIALDDFGTGYSSLSYLKRFPLDCMKIDQSFVRGLPADRDDVAITRTIIALARNMRLKTVVEGIETEAQLAFAKAEGCDEFQGYLFSKPLPAAEVEKVLRGNV
jgi:diguanylate cyclase (GGDEF)-like protein